MSEACALYLSVLLPVPNVLTPQAPLTHATETCTLSSTGKALDIAQSCHIAALLLHLIRAKECADVKSNMMSPSLWALLIIAAVRATSSFGIRNHRVLKRQSDIAPVAAYHHQISAVAMLPIS